ncbi:malonyl CoA-ACP transacylase [Candidatus Riesia sp. GBBU]|nr:malonyl CoA-ACP transacylase [Candidatus Riesia sp. GBBU]
MKNFAIIFPGQGSQHIGMLSDLFKKFSIIQETFNESSEVLGYNLWNLIQNGPKIELDRTWRSQPAILTASVSIFRLFMKKVFILPRIMAGHSLGEYSALVCSGVIDFRSAVRLVETRGKLMQESIEDRETETYAIIGIDKSTIRDICLHVSSKSQIVSISSFNSDEQVVISGDKKAVRNVLKYCSYFSKRKYFFPLSISVPSHCDIMKPAAKKLFNVLEEVVFKSPKIDVVNNVDVLVEKNENRIKQALKKHLYLPVRWLEIMRFIEKQGCNILFEIGPGNVLTNLSKRITRKVLAFQINNFESLNKALLKFL